MKLSRRDECGAQALPLRRSPSVGQSGYLLNSTALEPAWGSSPGPANRQDFITDSVRSGTARRPFLGVGMGAATERGCSLDASSSTCRWLGSGAKRLSAGRLKSERLAPIHRNWQRKGVSSVPSEIADQESSAMPESRSHKTTANRLATRYDAEYNQGPGADIKAKGITIEIETPDNHRRCRQATQRASWCCVRGDQYGCSRAGVRPLRRFDHWCNG